MLRLLPRSVLLVGLTIGLSACAHGLERSATVSPSERRGATDSTALVPEPKRPAVGTQLVVPDSVHWARGHAAREAAEVDPGMLLYTAPPPGTDMPIDTPPDSVDPDMIWPLMP